MVGGCEGCEGLGENAEELEICAGDREVGGAGVLGGAEDGAEDLGVEEGEKR